MTEQEYINFEQFIGLVQQERNENVSIERAIIRTFASNYIRDASGILELDRAPENDLENRVFREIVRRGECSLCVFCDRVDAARVPELLDQILHNLEEMMIMGMPMTGSQDDVIFGKMHGITLREFSMFFRPDYCQGVVRALVDFLQNASVNALVLAAEQTDSNDWTITEENFQSLCSGIVSSSVNTIIIDRLRVRGHRREEIHKILAEQIENSSSSIEKIHVEPHSDFSVQLLTQTLCQTPAIRNLDVSFRTNYTDDCDSLILNRNPWWKRHLGDMDTVPLKLLSKVLEKADAWNYDTSHSHLDVLFYLVKEKNPVLFLNVRRRRIRKRKRYGFDDA